MERLARLKISNQQKVLALRREISARWDHIDFAAILPDMNSLDTHKERDTKSTTTASEVHDLEEDLDDLRRPGCSVAMVSTREKFTSQDKRLTESFVQVSSQGVYRNINSVVSDVVMSTFGNDRKPVVIRQSSGAPVASFVGPCPAVLNSNAVSVMSYTPEQSNESQGTTDLRLQPTQPSQPPSNASIVTYTNTPQHQPKPQAVNHFPHLQHPQHIPAPITVATRPLLPGSTRLPAPEQPLNLSTTQEDSIRTRYPQQQVIQQKWPNPLYNNKIEAAQSHPRQLPQSFVVHGGGDKTSSLVQIPRVEFKVIDTDGRSKEPAPQIIKASNVFTVQQSAPSPTTTIAPTTVAAYNQVHHQPLNVHYTHTQPDGSPVVAGRFLKSDEITQTQPTTTSASMVSIIQNGSNIHPIPFRIAGNNVFNIITPDMGFRIVNSAEGAKAVHQEETTQPDGTVKVPGAPTAQPVITSYVPINGSNGEFTFWMSSLIS